MHWGVGARAERKITEKQAKLAKQAHKIACQPKTINCKKNQHHKISRKISTDHQQSQKESRTQKYNKQKPPAHRNGSHNGKKPTKNEEVTPRKTCKKPKSTKVSILARKINETMCKTIPKNKASRGLHIKNQKVQKNANKHTNNCAQLISKHCAKCK